MISVAQLHLAISWDCLPDVVPEAVVIKLKTSIRKMARDFAQTLQEKEKTNQRLAEAVENAQQPESAEMKAAREKIELEKKKQRDQVLQHMREERLKKLQEKKKEHELEVEADKLYPTTLLYERIMNKIIDFSFIPPPCPDFEIYEPPAGKKWGYRFYAS